jgi:hypothetical protein
LNLRVTSREYLLNTLLSASSTTSKTLTYVIPRGPVPKVPKLLKIHIVTPQVFFHNDIKKKCENNKLPLIFIMTPLLQVALFAFFTFSSRRRKRKIAARKSCQVQQVNASKQCSVRKVPRLSGV